MSDWQKIKGSGIWTEYENERTGEKSLHTHTPKVVKQWCPKGQHDYRIINAAKRLAVCSKCQHEIQFVVGKHQIKDDQVIL